MKGNKIAMLLLSAAIMIPSAFVWASAGDATAPAPKAKKAHHHAHHHKKSSANTPAAGTNGSTTAPK